MNLDALKKQVGTVADLIGWARRAAPRDAVVYHIGQLVTDRQRIIGLHDVAETVGLLQDTGYLIGMQIPMALAAFQGRAYWAIRTGGGFLPKSIAEQRVDATVYRALLAMRDRDAATSAPRMIRDTLSISDSLAADVLARLYALRLIEEGPNGRGWQLSALGARMLM